MKSMTGYAYNDKISDEAFISVEIKSYNSRFLDLTMNYPPYLGRLEKKIRDVCSAHILRGKVDVHIRIRDLNPQTTVEPDVHIARIYIDAIEKIAVEMGRTKNDIPIGLITQQEGVLQTLKEYDMDRYWNMIEPVLQDSIKEFGKDRDREGENTKKDLLQKLSKIEECHSFFVHWMPKMEEAFKNNLLTRFKELCGNEVNEQRIMSETAAMLVKHTISEEVVRLKSHIDAMKEELQKEAPGRRIDFICQEMNREINTIGSKNQFVEVGTYVIEAKDALENIREQAKNIE
ncbi:MAG TPA: YicC/YloC family endoribonuclease [Treponemataceae bacterium]|nr:YicC/YloC family endoribonuclease [Treponemataceae bacterium]